MMVPDRAALDRHRDQALALGAELRFDRSEDPDEPLYALADPAGHTFCMVVR
jgi:Glyoxalase-like domain